MTLIVLGHNLQTPVAKLLFSDDGEINDPEPTGNLDNLEPSEIFAAADSAITMPSDSGLKTILAGFQKIYPIPICVWAPSFVGDQFHGYRNVHSQYECFLAIAGSTLTAQHVINSVTEHLSKLRITHYYKNDDDGEREAEARYKVVRHCEYNRLQAESENSRFSEDLYAPDDMRNLLNADQIACVVQYSIRAALTSARKYKLDQNELNSMRTEFALGVRCPIDNSYRLFEYVMDFVIGSAGMFEISLNRKEIISGEISVLGLASDFKSEAQKVLDRSIENRKDIPTELFDFLTRAIDSANDSENASIDRPAFLTKFYNGRLHFVRKQE